MNNWSLIIRTSSELGFGFFKKAFSKEYRTLFSMEVLFFRRLPIMSWCWRADMGTGLVVELTVPSASSNHFCSSGFSLHMFLKERLSASKREMVVWEKSLPYMRPMARPTSPWVYPSLILRCLNSLANSSNSSSSMFSSAGRSRQGMEWQGESRGKGGGW